MDKKSQNSDYSQYYHGDVPTFNPGGSVDYSQISSMFSRTPETMQLVAQYAPDIPREVSYVFDFSNAGAYGVYIPSLIEEMKTDELKRQLEQRGYTIKPENGTMVAYPKKEEGKTSDSIYSEIKQLWNQISQGKSEVLGVNMNKVKSASESNMNRIVSNAANAGIEVSNPQLLWDMLVMLELGATIVHEWEHSRGGDEAAAKAREQDFVSQTLPTIQAKYQTESGGEEMMVGTAKGHNWYRHAQYNNGYMPQSLVKPSGSDLDGRFNRASPTDDMIAGWAMMAMQDERVPIENRLGREGMWPLAKGLSQEHDIIEEQLRKQTFSDDKPDPRLIYEELLSKDRDDSQAYKSIEQLMEERRPTPIMVPLEKTASLKKQSTLFGWYNNLEISDGSTIPGLGDRVMAWDDRDEDFSREEDWIKHQPRYNPTYDLKGFYYRWIEPRFKPQLWDDMTNDLSNTHPAKRFAQVNIDTDISQILYILENIRDRILAGKIKANRLLVSNDLYPFIVKSLKCEGVEVKAFRFGQTVHGDYIYSIWAFDPSVPVDSIRKVEHKFQNANASDDVEDVVEELLGFSSYRASVVEEVINVAKRICESNNIIDLYVIGMYAREKAFGNVKPDVEQLDFCTASATRNAQLGQLMAHVLGVAFQVDNDVNFIYKGIRVEFSVTNSKKELAQLAVLNTRIKNQLAIDLLRRDFTINMLAYNVARGTVEDPLRVARLALKTKTIKTFFDPSDIVKKNPIIILRALKLKLQHGLEIDKELQKTMISRSSDLFKGSFPTFQLIFARESIRSEGNKEADKLFDQFGLWKIKKLS